MIYLLQKMGLMSFAAAKLLLFFELTNKVDLFFQKKFFLLFFHHSVTLHLIKLNIESAMLRRPTHNSIPCKCANARP